MTKFDPDGRAIDDYKANGIDGPIISDVIEKTVMHNLKKIEKRIRIFEDWGFKFEIIFN